MAAGDQVRKGSGTERSLSVLLIDGFRSEAEARLRAGGLLELLITECPVGADGDARPLRRRARRSSSRTGGASWGRLRAT
jgi:hypothetical protein